MSTILMPGEPATEITGPPTRMLHIAANLLPPEIAEARHSHRLRRIIVFAVAAFAVLLLIGIGAAFTRTSLARSDVADSQDQTLALTRQQQQYAEVVKVRGESDAISAELTSLLASDLQWSRLFASLQTAAPSGVQVTNVAGALAPEAGTRATTASAASAAPNKAAAIQAAGVGRLIGTLTVTGTGATKTAVATYLDALAKVPGLANPLLGSTNLTEGAQQFTMRLDITDAALGGRYAAVPAASKGPGK